MMGGRATQEAYLAQQRQTARPPYMQVRSHKYLYAYKSLSFIPLFKLILAETKTAGAERDDGRHGRPRPALPARHAAPAEHAVPATDDAATHAATDACDATATATRAARTAPAAATAISTALLKIYIIYIYINQSNRRMQVYV